MHLDTTAQKQKVESFRRREAYVFLQLDVICMVLFQSVVKGDDVLTHYWSSLKWNSLFSKSHEYYSL